jgi:hypothetical protein
MTEEFFECRTENSVSQLEAQTLHATGDAYGMRIVQGGRLIKFTSIPRSGVTLTLFDLHSRNTWALSWILDGEQNGMTRLSLGCVTATCYPDEAPDPHRVADAWWRAILFARTDGGYLARYTNIVTGRSRASDCQSPQPLMPFPEFGDYRAFLDFDYSAFESVVHDVPPEIFPQGLPQRIPRVKDWQADGRAELLTDAGRQ